jgi:flavin-dependent dehydrogenase
MVDGRCSVTASTDHCDVAIVGGGPAGSTVGSILKKYSPHLDVRILEQSIFPRHHVGESLLASGTSVLMEMGAYEKVDNAGFVEKFGASFAWGRTRELWHFDFSYICRQLESGGLALPREYFKGWQVNRGQYDKILLDHARDCGVVVEQGAQVTDIRLKPVEPATVRYQKSDQLHDLVCRMVVDASGQNAILARRLNLREFDDHLRNVAVFAYWEGAKWKYEYLGHPQLTRILVTSSPRGWLWYIPIAKNLVSVGFVTHSSILRTMDDYRTTYVTEALNNPEIGGLLNGAAITRLAPDQPSDIMTVRDWSYTSRRMASSNWILVGDAAGFVDPILSSGVALAQLNGRNAAYTIKSVFSTTDSSERTEYLDFYDATYKVMLQAYREMARFWYANNYSTDGWWWRALREVTAGTEGAKLTNRDAFIRLAAGYANRLESVHLFGSYGLTEALGLADLFFGGDKRNPTDRSALPFLPAETFVKLCASAELTSGYVFFRGQIHRIRRLHNRAANKSVDLYPAEIESVSLLNKGCFVRDLNPSQQSLRRVEEFLYQLIQSGLVVDARGEEVTPAKLDANAEVRSRAGEPR